MKRMIDNKEFEALKGEVSTLKQEAVEISKAKDKGMYFALEEPTENTGVYTYTNTTIGNLNPNIPLKVGDLIMSFDATDTSDIKSSNLWTIDEIGEDFVKVVFVGKVGGSGKQLYQHFIKILINNPPLGSNLVDTPLYILNDNSEQMTFNDILNYLETKGFTNNLNVYPFTTYIYNSSSISCGVFNDNGTLKLALTNINSASQSIIPSTTSIEDKVIPL